MGEKGIYIKVGKWEQEPGKTAVFYDYLYIGSPFIPSLEENLQWVRNAVLNLKKELEKEVVS
jgi:hypothetical protein